MDISRRSALLAAIGAATIIGLQAVATVPARAAAVVKRRTSLKAPRNPAFTGGNSPNGWPVNTGSGAGGSIWSRPVPGTGSAVDVSIGAVETILVHVIRRFHYEIDALGPGDVVGFRPARGLVGSERNHASGTAIDIRPDFYPPGVSGGFFPSQLAVVRDILADCEGVVIWGGDFATPHEAHFEIGRPSADTRVAALASKLRGWKDTPGSGAGVIQDPADKHRHMAAARLERWQHR